MIDPVSSASLGAAQAVGASFDASIDNAQLEKAAVAVGTAIVPVVLQVTQMAMSIGQEAATATDE